MSEKRPCPSDDGDYLCPMSSWACFSDDQICDGKIDCTISEWDEKNCNTEAAAYDKLPCPSGSRMYKCPNSDTECYNPHDLCDTVRDCSDGFDEYGCPEPTRPDMMVNDRGSANVGLILVLVLILFTVLVIILLVYCMCKRRNAGRAQAKVTREYREKMNAESGTGSSVVVGGYMPTPTPAVEAGAYSLPSAPLMTKSEDPPAYSTVDQSSSLYPPLKT